MTALLIILGACSSGLEATAPIAPSSTPPPTVSPAPPTATTAPLVDLTERPLVWFAPLPPLLVDEGRPFVGSEDFMNLFSPDAPWEKAAERVHVFELYGEWVEDVPWTVHATDAELEQVVADLARRGIAIGVEMSPLSRPADCGTGIESWSGPDSGRNVAHRIRDAGGTIRYIAMDAPFAYASIVDGPNACRWPAETVAREILHFMEDMQAIFPEVVIGDTEPLWADSVEVEDYKEWMLTFREVAGFNLPFFHLDVDFGRPDWPGAAKELEIFAREQGVEFGIIYLGDWGDPSDEIWFRSAGERVKTYELLTGGSPDHILFQSWHDHPDFVLPESKTNTFTHFINQYFEDKASLGVPLEGSGANLAYGKPVTASASLPDFPPELALDGVFGTWWGAGDFAPQWIELDLGAPAAIAGVRLSISQDPDGETHHRVLGRPPEGGYELLHEFRGFTSNDDVLEHIPPSAWPGIRYVRVETVTSPSWVSWREIELISE